MQRKLLDPGQTDSKFPFNTDFLILQVKRIWAPPSPLLYSLTLLYSPLLYSLTYFSSGGGQGGGRPGEKGAGGVREAGEEGAGSGTKREKLRNIAQYFAIEKMQRGGSQKNTGREPGLKGTGSGRFKPPCPPPPHFLFSFLVRYLL